MKSDLKISGPKDAGKTTNWVQLSAVAVTALVCGFVGASLFQPSMQGRIVFGGRAQQATPDASMQLLQRKGAAASIDPGGAPGPAQAVSLPDKPGPAQAVSPPDQPGPAQTASPPDKPGPAQAANPPDQPGPAQAVGPPDKPAPAQAVSPPDNQRYPLAQPGAAPNIPDLPAFAQQLWNKYQGRPQGPNATGSTIVHKCVARVGCGGWGDRLRGMTTLFYFALLTDSQFDIVNTRPLDLAAAYPLIAQRRPAYSEEGVQRQIWMNNGMEFLATADLRAMVGPNKVHAVRCNGYSWHLMRRNPHLAELVAFYQLGSITVFDMFRVVMDLYFSQLSPQLQGVVEEQLQGMAVQGQRTHRVGVQIRNGGNWRDAIRHPTESARTFADQALLACKEAAPTPCWVYVTSDSQPAQDIFLQHIREQQPEVHVTGAVGTPMHVDLSAFDANDTASHLKSYVDWELLRRMDHLVVSRSGFGETAAWTSLIPAERMSEAATNDTFSLDAYDSVIGMPAGVHP